MDPRLQAQEVSPLVRTLGRSGTNVSAFVPGVPDHFDSYVEDKVVVQPYEGKDFGDTFRFKLPPYGFVKQMYIRWQTVALSVVGTCKYEVVSLRYLARAELLSEYNLQERMTREGLWAKVLTMPPALRSRMIQMMAGVFPSNGTQLRTNDMQTSDVVDMMVPLPFCVMESSHNWLNARHVQDLQVAVLLTDATTHGITVLNGLLPELVVTYVRMSDSIEKAIFNARYGEGGESVMVMSEMKEVEVINLPSNDTQAGLLEPQRVNLDERDVLTGIYLLLTNFADEYRLCPWEGFHTAGTQPGSRLFEYVQLWGNGRMIYEARGQELEWADRWGDVLDGASSFDSQHADAGDTLGGFIHGDAARGEVTSGLEAGATTSAVLPRAPDRLFRIPLSLSASGLYHTGGLATQTQNDLYLVYKIQPGIQGAAEPGVMHVLARTISLVSIDGRTGRMQKRLTV